MKKLLIALLLPLSVFASECPELYYQNKPIEIKNTVELCNSFYVSLFDEQHQRVILVSEHLHMNPNHVERKDAFRYDVRVGKIPNPKQYQNSGYDKGHMAPAEDASTDEEMFETFLMTNMTPQQPTLNRKAWRELEESIHKNLFTATTDTYVVTIAVYNGNEEMNGIPIPTGYWKIVMVDNTTKYYYADNVVEAKVVEKSPVDVLSLLPIN